MLACQPGERPLDELAAPEAAPDYADAVGAIVAGLAADGCPVTEGGDVAGYMPRADRIIMPPAKTFATADAHAAVLLHEATHATGHAKRLARDLSGRFGDAAYAAEELIAEMGAAFLCGSLGVGTRGVQHPEYIADWLRVLRGDRYAIFTAAREAERAADWLRVRAGLDVAAAADGVAA